MFAEEIYDLPFKGFENIDLKKMLMGPSETFYMRKKRTREEAIREYINSRLYDRFDYEYVRKDNNQFVAVYSDMYFRQDHFKNFCGFIKEFAYFDYVIPVKLEKERLNIKRCLWMLRYDIGNFFLMKKIAMPFEERIYLIRLLGMIRLYVERMSVYIDNKGYKYGLVYSDSCPYENILVQMMKRKDMRTATLQHGYFSAHNIFKGVEFRASVSDDFLAWNEYTKDLALECGIPEEKMKVLGIPRYINEPVMQQETNDAVFSVILGGRALDEENKKLVNYANLLAEKEGMKYFLRYHPACTGTEYSNLVNEKYFVGVEERSESIKEMCGKSRFSLVGSGTSVVIDLIYLNQPFFEYKEDWDGKEYQKRSNYFGDIERLAEQVESKCSIDNSLFKYYCTTKKVKDNYGKYFESIMN